jgi:hypothetical protein
VSLAVIVAWTMFAVLIGWLAVVLWSTFRTLEGETREARERRGDDGGSG